MRELGIQTKASLKKMYYDALVEAGKIKEIMTERKARKAVGPKRRALTIGKRGTMLLSKPLLVEQLGFSKEISSQFQKEGIASSLGSSKGAEKIIFRVRIIRN